jgi:hypothetical protein
MHSSLLPTQLDGEGRELWDPKEAEPRSIEVQQRKQEIRPREQDKGSLRWKRYARGPGISCRKKFQSLVSSTIVGLRSKLGSVYDPRNLLRIIVGSAFYARFAHSRDKQVSCITK